MASESILKKSDSLPKFLQDVFRCIDSKDFDGAKAFFEDDFRLYFAHYILSGVKQSLDFVGAFDKRLANYEHVMGDIYVGDQIVTFDDILRVWLEDRVLIETPSGTKSQSTHLQARSHRPLLSSASQPYLNAIGQI